MSTTNLFLTTGSLQSHQETIEKDDPVQTGERMVNLRKKSESERLLYRLSRQGASPKFDGIELFVFLFLASITAVYSGNELIHLLHSGALEQTVKALLKR